MSNTVSIDIKFLKHNSEIVSPVAVIQKLLDYGWTLSDNGKVSYLPLGDNDDFNWQTENIDVDSLMKIVYEKEKCNEIIGIVLTWKDTGAGGNVLIWNDGNLSFNLSINRRFLDSIGTSRITDVNWYITKLLPVLNNDGLRTILLEFKEHF